MPQLEIWLPNLNASNYEGTSDRDRHYNCIAWAAGENRIRYWPNVQGYKWPVDLPDDETPQTFEQFYSRLGYELCAGPELEEGFEKIAIYMEGDQVLHAARQLPDGHWTSKLGEKEDIEHHSLGGIEGGTGTFRYGRATVYMRRVKSRAT